MTIRPRHCLITIALLAAFVGAGCSSQNPSAEGGTTASGKNSFGEEGAKAKLCDELRAKMNAAPEAEKGAIAAELEKNGCGY